MEKIHMWDIISLLGITYPTSGQSSYYVQCPCCDENPRKKHLNINLKRKFFVARAAVLPAEYSIYMRYIPAFRATKSAKQFWHKWEYLRMLRSRGRKFCRKRIRNVH